jgi:hypothetical protein
MGERWAMRSRVDRPLRTINGPREFSHFQLGRGRGPKVGGLRVRPGSGFAVTFRRTSMVPASRNEDARE